MSFENLKHNIQSVLEGVEKYDSIIAHRDTSNKKQLKKIDKEMEKTKDFILKLSKKMHKLIENERRKIKA